jgi:hypothetical protein
MRGRRRLNIKLVQDLRHCLDEGKRMQDLCHCLDEGKWVQDLRHCLDEGKRVVSTLITEEDRCDVVTTPPVRSCADLLLGCRPKGSVSRFWVLFDDEFSDADSGLSTASSCTWNLERGFGFDQRKSKLSNPF